MKVSWRVGIFTVFASGVLEAQPVSFQRDIRPVLAARCVMCHQAQNGGGKLSLAAYAGLLKGGASGSAIKAGDPDASALLQFVSGQRPRMHKIGGPEAEVLGALIRR